MRYMVREHDQHGRTRFVVEGDRIWRGEYVSGMANMTITTDPYDAERRYVRLGNARGEQLYYVVPAPYGEGWYVQERDTHGRRLYYVEPSRYDEGALLVREGNQHGSVAYYVMPAREWARPSEGYPPREPGLYARLTSHVADFLWATRMRHGLPGVIAVLWAWLAVLTVLFAFVLPWNFLTMLLYGALVVESAFFVATHA